MASCILTLMRVLGSSASKLKCASTRGFCQPSGRSPFQELDSHLQDLNRSLSPSVVTLDSLFIGPDNREIHHSYHRGAGVFLDPALIITSAHVVGRVGTYFEPKTVQKQDRFNHGCILHKSYIGSTFAISTDGQLLPTRPLAVNFVNDLAVLEVVKPEGNLFPHCAVANCLPNKEDILMAFAREYDFRFMITLGTVRAIGEKTIRAKAPWPLDDELRWMEHDWFVFGRGDPPPWSTLFNCRQKVTGSMARVSGSPWFNLHGEVVGIASWEVTDEKSRFSVGYAVPPLCIRAMVDYAKTKRPEDPIVMDSWIGAHFLPGTYD